jgi:uncharacterized protein YndB with AHSA1/START domain
MSANNSSETKTSQGAQARRTSLLSQDKRELTITRILDAPRALVFKTWIEPEHMAQWWGPKYFTNPVCELDPRPGGAILIHMQDADGAVYPMKGHFDEIVEPERLVMTTGALEDDQGNFLLEDTTTVTFEEIDGKTLLTIRAMVTKAEPQAAGALEGMEEGWNQSLDKLEDYVAAV